MRILVINLPASKARRASAVRQLQAHGCDYEFVDGVLATSARAAGFAARDERAFMINTGRHSTAGEIGCYAAHLRAWQRAVELNEPVVVMEDDFVLLPGFLAALAVVQEVISERGFVRLQTESRGRKCAVSCHGEFVLMRYVKAPHGAMCYAIAPAVAAAFANASKVLKAPVDVFIKMHWRHRQPLYGLIPYTVGESGHCLSSTIEFREKAARGVGLRLARLAVKLRGGIAAMLQAVVTRGDRPVAPPTRR